MEDPLAGKEKVKWEEGIFLCDKVPFKDRAVNLCLSGLVKRRESQRKEEEGGKKQKKCYSAGGGTGTFRSKGGGDEVHTSPRNKGEKQTKKKNR